MIKASDLRPGNIVDTPDGIKQITGIVRGKHVAVVYWEYEKHCASHMCNPIPLTCAWMKKFGFVTADYEVDQIVWDYNDRFVIVQDGVPPEKQPFVFEWEDGGNNYETIVQYVHQLQNLYHALTGEELQIKEV